VRGCGYDASLQGQKGGLCFLYSEQKIIEGMSFHTPGFEQTPGLIAMQLNGSGFPQDIDKHFDGILVVFNNSSKPITFAHAVSFVHFTGKRRWPGI